jgi:hypothetical protein
MIPPPEKFSILNAGRETGHGVDKTEIRAHMRGWYTWQIKRITEAKT